MLWGSVKVPDTLGSLEEVEQLHAASAPMEVDEDAPTLKNVDENGEENYVVCAEVRRSPRANITQPAREAQPTDRHIGEDRLYTSEVPEIGTALFTSEIIGDGETICTYNGDYKGKIIKSRKEAAQASRGAYTLVIPYEKHWIKVDVRDKATGKSGSMGGNATDGINKTSNKSYWNAYFEPDPVDPTIVLIKTS
jgi:hypothetical protein